MRAQRKRYAFDDSIEIKKKFFLRSLNENWQKSVISGNQAAEEWISSPGRTRRRRSKSVSYLNLRKNYKKEESGRVLSSRLDSALSEVSHKEEKILDFWGWVDFWGELRFDDFLA